MKRKMIYILRCVISLLYCLILGVLFYLFKGLEWGAGTALAGFIFIILGSMSFSSGGRSLPVMSQSSSSTSSIDSTSIRNSANVGTIVEDSENQVKDIRWHNQVAKKERYSVMDLLFRRTAIELIIVGILSIVIGMSAYIEYFI